MTQAGVDESHGGVYGSVADEPLRLDVPARRTAERRAGVDPTLPERELEEAIRGAVGDRRGDLDGWSVDEASLWRVGLPFPVRESFGGRTLAEVLA